jgi:hypothetical protein
LDGRMFAAAKNVPHVAALQPSALRYAYKTSMHTYIHAYTHIIISKAYSVQNQASVPICSKLSPLKFPKVRSSTPFVMHIVLPISNKTPNFTDLTWLKA